MNRLILILFIMSTVFVSAQMQSAKIFVPSDSFDFGSIPEGQTVTHNFIIVNTGGDVLKIGQVISSCGCTAAAPEKKELNPGESTTMKVEFNSIGRSGKQVKQISVSSNDPITPRIQFVISGNVVDAKTFAEQATGPKIVFEKSQHDFGKIYEGKIVEYTFKFKNAGKGVLNVKDVKTTCGCTAAVVSGKKLKPGEEGTIKIEFDSSNRFGRTSRNIIVSSNDPDEGIKTLTIYADILKKES
jgi:hypothetical protein